MFLPFHFSLPSPSKDSDDSEGDEYGKKPWEEEEEEEEVKREDNDVNHEEMMEVLYINVN